MEPSEQVILKQIVDTLKENGIDFSGLVVAYCGPQVFLGEPELFLDAYGQVKLIMKNPRRFLALESPGPNGSISARFALIDFHLLAGKSTKIILFPQAIINIADQDEDTQLRYAVLYAEYLEMMKKMKAKEAGIVIPDMKMPQNGRQVR